MHQTGNTAILLNFLWTNFFTLKGNETGANSFFTNELKDRNQQRPTNRRTKTHTFDKRSVDLW